MSRMYAITERDHALLRQLVRDVEQLKLDRPHRRDKWKEPVHRAIPGGDKGWRAILGTSHEETADEQWSYEWVEGEWDPGTKATVVKAGGRSSKDDENEEDPAKRAWNLHEETDPEDYEGSEVTSGGTGFVRAGGKSIRAPHAPGTVVDMRLEVDSGGDPVYVFSRVNAMEPWCEEEAE